LTAVHESRGFFDGLHPIQAEQGCVADRSPGSASSRCGASITAGSLRTAVREKRARFARDLVKSTDARTIF